MSVLQPALNVIHLLRGFCFYVFQFIFFVGRSVFWLLSELCLLLRELFFAVVIIGEELYRFLCEVDDIVSAVGRYLQTSTNSGFGSVVAALRIFGRETLHFFSNTRILTRLLATHAGHWVLAFFALLRDALLLIADCLWFVLTIVPRLLLRLLLVAGDAFVFVVSGAGRIAVSTAHTLMDDIFRLTVGAVLVFLLWRHRSGISVVLSVLWNNVKARLRQFQVFHWIRRLQRNPPSMESFSFLNTSWRPTSLPLPSPNCDKVNEELRCVACRDRPKCVVLLPCRHLCLCEECTDYMSFASGLHYCPLCRTHVAHTISVYV